MGLLFGAAIGLVGVGRVPALVYSSEVSGIVGRYGWWIVVLCMIVPLAEYLSGVRTTFTGMITRHPFRHMAGFFAGVSVGLGLFILLAPRFL